MSAVSQDISVADTLLPRSIDTVMFELPGSTAAHLIPGPQPALIDTGSALTTETLLAELHAAGVDHLASIVLTHIHFDHAGGAGHLARSFPEATVYIHTRVARHLIDPARLTESVRAVWGPQTDQLFGIPEPISSDRVRAIDHGDRISLGDRDLLAVATPGHTRAHLAWLDEATGAMVCGDALGIQLQPHEAVRPATPPADFSFDETVASIDRIRAIEPDSLWVAHFGQVAGTPDEICDRSVEALRRWHELFLEAQADSPDREGIIRRFNTALSAGFEPVTPEVSRQLEAITPAWLNVDGMLLEAERLAQR